MLLKSLMVVILLCLAFMLGIWVRDQREMVKWYNKNEALKALQVVLPKRKVDTERMLSVTSPQQGAFLAHTFQLEGKARGGWYFEGTFPLVIENESGVILETIPIHAQGDWLTPDFVPFSETIQLPYYSGKATLILKNANPSGRSESDASLAIPVTVQ